MQHVLTAVPITWLSMHVPRPKALRKGGRAACNRSNYTLRLQLGLHCTSHPGRPPAYSPKSRLRHFSVTVDIFSSALVISPALAALFLERFFLFADWHPSFEFLFHLLSEIDPFIFFFFFALLLLHTFCFALRPSPLFLPGAQ